MANSITQATYLPRVKLATQVFGDKPLLNSPSEAERQFLEISKKPPLERLRDKILEDMKTSDEQIAQMEPEERQAIEEEIARRMKEALNGNSTQSGAQVDKSV